MDSLTLLIEGFQHNLTWVNITAAFIGCLLGTFIGILPGIGPAATLSIMIPIAFGMRPESALIMMCATYLGAMYGGSLTSILMKVPGETSSVMTAIDGYEMAKQGRAASALAISAIGSFIGGTLSVVALTLFALPLARSALALGPAEYFTLVVAALVFIAVMVGKDLLKSITTISLGILIATIGGDWQTGVTRLTFGLQTLADGIPTVVIVIGVFGVGEVFWLLTHRDATRGDRLAIRGRLWLSWDEWRRSWPATLRGTAIGFIVGVMPGSGSSLGALLAYAAEQRVSKEPEKFGKGAIEAVASCETANNAATGGALIPMLALGIPGSGTAAVLLIVFMMYGFQPGPRLMVEHPQVIWTIVASLYISNVILVILNLPLIPLWVRILDIPARFLMPMIVAIATVGAYSIDGRFDHVMMVWFFGGLGYALRLLQMSPLPLIIGVVLGRMMEQRLRQAMLLADGDWTTFLTKPICVVFLASALFIVVFDTVSRVRASRAAALLDVAREEEAT